MHNTAAMRVVAAVLLVVLALGCGAAPSGDDAGPALEGDAGSRDPDSGPATTDAGAADARDAGDAAPKGDVPFPALDADFPDPFVLRVGATYHAYATNVGVLGGHLHVAHAKSSDLAKWSARDDAMPALGSWAEDSMFTWAPGVLEVNGGFVLFYAAKKKGTAPQGQTGEQCVGRATSSKPEGPFVDGFGAPLICNPQGYWAIDPSPYHAKNGKDYLLWRQDTPGNPAVNHVWIQELAASGTGLVGGPVDLLARSAAWENPVLENPSMLEIGGKVLLFYSANDWASAGYGVGYAECASVTGPCTKVTTQGPWFGSIFAIAGPGGQDFFTDTNGDRWMSYHAWVAPKVGYASGGARVLALARIGLDAQQRPQLQKATLP